MPKIVLEKIPSFPHRSERGVRRRHMAPSFSIGRVEADNARSPGTIRLSCFWRKSERYPGIEMTRTTKYQRCRGIPLGDGNFGGCAYGDGEYRVLEGPCDCPVCNGSGWERVTATFIPHADFGDPECCGFLQGVTIGSEAEIECNECGAVIRSVPVNDLQRTLQEMEATLDVATAMCPHCRTVNLFPGFTEMLAFICKKCGRPVEVRK